MFDNSPRKNIPNEQGKKDDSGSLHRDYVSLATYLTSLGLIGAGFGSAPYFVNQMHTPVPALSIVWGGIALAGFRVAANLITGVSEWIKEDAQKHQKKEPAVSSIIKRAAAVTPHSASRVAKTKPVSDHLQATRSARKTRVASLSAAPQHA